MSTIAPTLDLTKMAVFAPAITSCLIYTIARKVMDIVSSRFIMLKSCSGFIAFLAANISSGILQGRMISTIFVANPILARLATAINLVALAVIWIGEYCQSPAPASTIKRSAAPPAQSSSMDSLFRKQAELQASTQRALDALAQEIKEPSIVRDMRTASRVASYAVLSGRDDCIREIERYLHRPKGMQSVILVGEPSSQPGLIAEECARRIARKALQPGSPLLNKRIYFINTSELISISIKDLIIELDSIAQNCGAILVMDQIELLGEESVWTRQTLGNYITSGQISLIGITTPGQYAKVQSFSFASSLAPIQVSPLEAQHCFSVLQTKNQQKYFTSNTPNVTLSDDALTLATLFSYHHVVKSFVIKNAAALLSDILFKLGNPAAPLTLTKELFLQHWRDVYLQDPTKISLASLSSASRAFFTERGIDIDECIALVTQLNKNKKNEHLGNKDMPLFLSDMNEAAREGKYESCIGRDEEISEVIRTLRQSKNNSLVLLGAPGIGKTAIPEEIARRIVVKDPSVAHLHDKTLYWVNVNALTGTAGIVGRLEKAVESMIDFCKQRGGDAILVIDELHLLRGAGSHRESKIDVFEMIKNSLARNEIIVIGSANDYKWKPVVLEDPAIERRIKSIHVKPPTPSVCVEMLNHVNSTGGYTRSYESPHVEVTAEAVQAAIYLTVKWMKERHLPDKATVLISEAVAFFQDREEITRGLGAFDRPKKQITPDDVAGCLYHSIRHTLSANVTERDFIESATRHKFYIKEDDSKKNDN